MLNLEECKTRLSGISPKQLESLKNMPGVKERIGAAGVLTDRQKMAHELLDSDARHIMLFGGSRSGKTFLIVRDIISRALFTPSRHAIMRFRFNNVVTSIAKDTLPKVISLCFPNLKGKMNQSLWYYTMENGSEIWFGGLDEKERTEKILGQEYATIFLNECSQIGFSARNIALTRLAQNTPLKNRMYYDCNPPSKMHWSHQLFVDKIDPSRHQPLPNPDHYASLQMNPSHNMANLSSAYIEELEGLDERKRKRFLMGVFSDDDDTALWTPEMLDNGRLIDQAPPEMQRVIVAVDPSGCSGPEDLRSDEVGIVVVGLGVDGRGYVLEDLTGRFGPEKWKTIVASAYNRHRADAVVAEVNYGGAMVREVIRTASTDKGLPIVFREVTATRGKIIRAEPIAALWSQGKISLVGRFEEMEYQLCSMTTGGYIGDRSPDRADAMIWGLTAVFPAITRESRRRRSHAVILGYADTKRRYRR